MRKLFKRNNLRGVNKRRNKIVDTVNKKAEVARLFAELGKLLKQNMRKSVEDSGLTMPQTMVIGTLIKYGEMKITELSNKVNLSNSTISGIVDRLEKQQLVVRVRSEEDRRTVYVKVTEKVEEFHEGIHRKIEESFEELLSTGTSEDMDKIIEGLNTLKRIIRERKSDENLK
jgi:MarR family transcriptional regulator, organic hydroperoxide resistance regulator